MSKELNEKLESTTEGYVKELIETLNTVDFKKVSELITGANILSRIKNILLKDITMNSLINIFGEEGDNRHYFLKLLNGEYNEYNFNEFLGNINSEDSTALLFYSCYIRDILTIIIDGNEENVESLLGGA